MRERLERVASPGAYVTASFTQPFLFGPVCFRTALTVLWWLSPGEGWDAVT